MSPVDMAFVVDEHYGTFEGRRSRPGLTGFLLFVALRGEGRGPPEVRVELMAPTRLGPGRVDGAVPRRQRWPRPVSQLVLARSWASRTVSRESAAK